ncbi:hypothetical protein GCM10018779_33610 [Streptomyces griseocarneus]|nr:hypothetical protein GCM10018779_33610 [Streptomyces griseocarneus]
MARLSVPQWPPTSLQRAAAVLGLGERAVTSVPVDLDLDMDAAALKVLLKEAASRGETLIAVVATTGTTDTGGIDPLPLIADSAEWYGVWLHMDAAYGGGALLSDWLAQASSAPTRSAWTGTSWAGNRPPPESSWSGGPRPTPRWADAPSISTRPTTRKRATPACWASP